MLFVLNIKNNGIAYELALRSDNVEIRMENIEELFHFKTIYYRSNYCAVLLIIYTEMLAIIIYKYKKMFIKFEFELYKLYKLYSHLKVQVFVTFSW